MACRMLVPVPLRSSWIHQLADGRLANVMQSCRFEKNNMFILQGIALSRDSLGSLLLGTHLRDGSFHHAAIQRLHGPVIVALH